MTTTTSTMPELFQMLDEFYKLDPVLPIRLALTFCLVAKSGKEGATMKDVAALLDMPQSGASRQVSALSEKHWNKNKKGYGLIKSVPDPNNWKQKRLFLSEKGERLAARLEAIR